MDYATEPTSSQPPSPCGYGLLVPECKRRGISKTLAFALVASNDLRTFKIGKRRYVYIDSLESLPARIGQALTGGEQ